MAKKKSITPKKVTKQVKKAYKKNPKRTILTIVLFILIVGVFAFLYTQGYLDDFLKPIDKNPPITGSYEQDENCFYYYTYTNYESGDYYEAAKDKAGDELANTLHEIINEGFNPISYGDARYVLAYSDRDPKDDNKSVRGIYDNDVILTYWKGSGEGAWQREHVWPNSKLGVPRVKITIRIVHQMFIIYELLLKLIK